MDVQLSRQLSSEELSLLATYENAIESGLDSFVEVGNSLCFIRDNYLYRQNHKTFEAYLRDRWKMSRCRAYELITQAKVDANLSAVADKKPLTRRQASALNKLTPSEQAEAYREAAASADGEATTIAIEEAVERKLGGSDPKETAPKPSKPGKPREQKTDWVARHEELVAEIRDIAGEIDSSLELLGCARAHRELAELFDRYAEQCER